MQIFLCLTHTTNNIYSLVNYNNQVMYFTPYTLPLFYGKRIEQLDSTSCGYHTAFDSRNLSKYREHLPLEFSDTDLTIKLIKSWMVSPMRSLLFFI